MTRLRPRTDGVPRGRVLVLGDGAPVHAALDRLHQPCVRVRNIFEAIGTIATTPPRDAIRVAIVADSPAADRHAQALRRLDPTVRLLRLGGNDAPGAFEAVVHTAEECASALGPEWLQDAPAAPTPGPARPPAPAEVAPPSIPLPGPADTELLDAILGSTDDLAHVALDHLRARTAIADAALLASEPEHGGTAVPVGDGVTRHGWLSGSAPAEALAAWAAWLDRWLTLDSRYRAYREMAFRDDLTGSWNRRYFDRFVASAIETGRARRRPVTVMVFDIDDFKRYNDAYGHEAGDVILRETVALLNSVIRDCDRVCRIGGDEFVVVFADLDAPREEGSNHPATVEAIARRFQRQISLMRFPKLGDEAPGTLSISGGLATFPWDGDDAETLLRLADRRALESKRRGKNDLTLGPGLGGGAETP